MNDGLQRHETQGSLVSYVVGFCLSIILTLLAYFSVDKHWFSRTTTIAFITILALVQFVVQMLFFLHLSQESRPRWRLIVLGFMAVIVVIIVSGSLWIMNNLNYNMRNLSPGQQKTYLHDHEGL